MHTGDNWVHRPELERIWFGPDAKRLRAESALSDEEGDGSEAGLVPEQGAEPMDPAPHPDLPMEPADGQGSPSHTVDHYNSEDDVSMGSYGSVGEQKAAPRSLDSQEDLVQDIEEAEGPAARWEGEDEPLGMQTGPFSVAWTPRATYYCFRPPRGTQGYSSRAVHL